MRIEILCTGDEILSGKLERAREMVLAGAFDEILE